ncbi:double-strand break repair protein AddB [Anianabacter salinae]|uniref:double-strand break repair protein AddB n=1 Tax=Anianabacter salinae TaxID=2851023 RepID=UPI00225DFD09|nr:double-strand break repair protein AddB [Anianabacter salinae]MBV0913496.1 double-strand break repair protein AddB [Anianabacter salinae]
MFSPQAEPRVFGLAPGTDFPRALVEGLIARLGDAPPEALARAEVFVNTRRMQRRIREVFDAGPPRLLPRVRLVTDLGLEAAMTGLPPAVPPLRRRLELATLVAGLLDTRPDLAPRAALFDLADSLARLLDEMHGEGVSPAAIRALDVSDQSGHWQNSLAFVALVERFIGESAAEEPDAEARQRLVIERKIAEWQAAPPDHPVIVAGSTGSRGATALLMQAVAGLPQGAVVLPGFDFDQPGAVWDNLHDALTGEDHPQYRFAAFCARAGIDPLDVRRWAEVDAPVPPRNRLVSLALRPAPVTDQWMTEGPALAGIAAAAERMTLIEAASLREEATAIAVALRDAAEQGRRAALITPDRTLTRQVTAALGRWGILPDDSAGRPLPLTPPGRLLRHVAGLMGQRLTSEALLTVLKHPLTSSGHPERADHLRLTRDLELHVRRTGMPFPEPGRLAKWAAQAPDRAPWLAWCIGVLRPLEGAGPRALPDHVAQHMQVAEALAAGPGAPGAGALWEAAAGRAARAEMEALQREAGHGPALSPTDYASLFHAILQRTEVREPVQADPRIAIWGTLEARVQGADLVICAGLNEGVWPEAASPDPWLNRRMRRDAGLRLPERQIGLSAHDFQQAICAPEVILTRAIRDAEAQTVPSRWLNRLVNLMGGVSDESREALGGMRARGARLVALARAFDTPEKRVDPSPRPAPRPPAHMRLTELTITQVQTLIRHPYDIYARRILSLQALDPIRQSPDAPLRGTIQHSILERFVKEGPVTDLEEGRARLLRIADEELAAHAPWPVARAAWRARIERIADWFVQGEIARQAEDVPLAQESRAAMVIDGVRLYGKIDRIDRRADGTLAIYDYKTGAVPTDKQMALFDKQLHLSALLAEAGAVDGVDAATVGRIAHIGFGSGGKVSAQDLGADDLLQTRDEFRRLIAAYARPDQGFTARRAMESLRYSSDFDHLARYGEWDDATPPHPEDVGHDPE